MREREREGESIYAMSWFGAADMVQIARASKALVLCCVLELHEQVLWSRYGLNTCATYLQKHASKQASKQAADILAMEEPGSTRSGCALREDAVYSDVGSHSVRHVAVSQCVVELQRLRAATIAERKEINGHCSN
jgi:hypothetical protein